VRITKVTAADSKDKRPRTAPAPGQLSAARSTTPTGEPARTAEIDVKPEALEKK